MTLNRRTLLRNILAAPAIVAAAHIMPVRSLIAPTGPILWADGLHNDLEAFQAWARHETVFWPDGKLVRAVIDGRKFYIAGGPIWFGGDEKRPLAVTYSLFSGQPCPDRPWSPEIGRAEAWQWNNFPPLLPFAHI